MLRRAGSLAAVTLLLAAASAEARPTVPAGWMGMVAGAQVAQYPERVPGQFRAMAAAGVESVKAEFDWATIEAEPGAYDWEATDALVSAAAHRGLRLLPTVDQAPRWAARPKRGREGVRHPRDPRDFGRFLAVLVHRYGPDGSYWDEHPALPRRPIRSWEIWNEPDIPYYWKPPWVAGYVDLLRAAHRAVKRADPGALVVLAGLTNRSWHHLDQLYDAGARPLFDVVSAHPYTRRVAHVVDIVRLERRVMRAHHDARTPVWITELSWTSGRGRIEGGHDQPNFINLTPRGQAARLREGYLALARVRRRYRIGRVYWYTWLSRDISTTYPFDYSGLLRIRGDRFEHKPALRAYRAVAHRLARRG